MMDSKGTTFSESITSDSTAKAIDFHFICFVSRSNFNSNSYSYSNSCLPWSLKCFSKSDSFHWMSVVCEPEEALAGLPSANRTLLRLLIERIRSGEHLSANSSASIQHLPAPCDDTRKIRCDVKRKSLKKSMNWPNHKLKINWNGNWIENEMNKQLNRVEINEIRLKNQ